MKNSITINKQNLAIKEYKEQRVVTFKDIDTVHGRPYGTSGRNFRTNKSRFIEDVDYFKISPDEFRRAFGNMDTRQRNDIIVITESGYLMLVKSFTDDLAWTVQRELVNSYFNSKASAAEPPEHYEYYDKYYKGQPVMTMRDFTYFTGVNCYTAEWTMRNKGVLEKGKDYLLLEGAALSEFKRENPKISRLVGFLIVLTQSGFIKLCRHYGINVKTPECFNCLPERKIKWATKSVVDVCENQKIQKCRAEILEKVNGIKAILDLSNRYSSMEVYESYMMTLKQLGMLLGAELCSLASEKPNVVEKYY